MAKHADGLIHFLAGHRLDPPVTTVEPNTTCPDCNGPVHRFLKKSGGLSAGYKRDGSLHECGAGSRWPNVRRMPDQFDRGPGDHPADEE